jgi:hypothetical protein
VPPNKKINKVTPRTIFIAIGRRPIQPPKLLNLEIIHFTTVSCLSRLYNRMHNYQYDLELPLGPPSEWKNDVKLTGM